MANYRPITELSFLSKIIERVVLKQLDTHMSLHNLHCDQQFGYKKNHSTELLLLNMMDDVFKACDNSMGVVVIQIDLSSAFDTVDHDKLIFILENDMHVTGTALKWFKSFLYNRSQSVKIMEAISDVLPVSYGVPQGSVLGPFLYNIYDHGLNNVFQKSRFSNNGYADDNYGSKWFSSFFQYETLIIDVPNCISNINEYMNDHFLKLNETKTSAIIFGSKLFLKKISLNGTILHTGEVIMFKNSIKHLGFLLDKSLEFELQINQVFQVVI